MYEIEIEHDEHDHHDHKERYLTETVTSQYIINDLHSGTTYKYRIRAIGTNENLKGPWSAYQFFVTGQLI